MAAGIMRILHQRGVQLPQQLSIVGFDDVVLARYLYPALTTMHYPVEQMARCAAQLAIQLYGHYAAAQQQSFQCRTGDPRFCRALFSR